MRVCYFDCFSGAAGDMLLASLVDAAGQSRRDLLPEVQTMLGLLHEIRGEWDLSCSTVTRSAGCIAAKHIQVGSVMQDAFFGHFRSDIARKAVKANSVL